MVAQLLTLNTGNILLRNRHSHLPNSSHTIFHTWRKPHVQVQYKSLSATRIYSSICIKSNTTETPSTEKNRKNITSLLHGVTKVIVTWLLSIYLCTGFAYAASSESIRASSLGLRVATFLRKSGFPDEAVVFIVAMLPILELRGAIPVGYWMQLDPLKIFALSVAGNMVPVPLILLYLDKLSSLITARSSRASEVLDSIYKSTRRKAGPIQEFKWLGLMLFVAVPFPGTGAWTGAIASVVLGMPFWSSFWANFLGVVIAGILVNLLVNLGLNYALLVGIALFTVSTFMWSFLRLLTSKANQQG